MCRDIDEKITGVEYLRTLTGNKDGVCPSDYEELHRLWEQWDLEEGEVSVDGTQVEGTQVNGQQEGTQDSEQVVVAKTQVRKKPRKN